ncbi:hypothetical protein F2P79_020338 [Xyrichtys novacula]|uniref:SET domain-containing protein n=1 Tax=Xyrichtys novacula TaxID=13765 RepID=A0AAV1H944_XYRNO|nr:hypothetical protein F2P79_020338 [Xyrichtys novacula]
MAARRRRGKPPLQDAIENAIKAQDKIAELEVKYINSFKGRGVFARTHFSKGDFVVEYRGQLITSDESARRRRTYHRSCAVFMFDFRWKEKTWCIDASQEDDSLGRLVNDDNRHPNCKMKKIVAEGKPYLCLFALRDIHPGEEIVYNYGDSDWPWRKQVCNKCWSSCAEMSSDTEVSRTAEKTAERQPSTTMQCDKCVVDELHINFESLFQSCAEMSSDTEVSRTAEKTAERQPSTTMQCDKCVVDELHINFESLFQSCAEMSSDTEVSRTAEKTAERQPSTTMQCDKCVVDELHINFESLFQSCAEMSSDTEVSRTAEKTAERQPSTTMQCDKCVVDELHINFESLFQSCAEMSSDTEVSRTAEKTAERQPSTTMQDLDESDSDHSANRTGIIPCLVDYTDSEESPSPHTSPLQLNESCETWSLSSESELTVTDQDKETVPKLRRTRSIQMKGRVDFDLDELYDHTSDDSGEEYIPESGEDSSEDSDPCNIKTDQKITKLRFPNFEKTADVRDGCLPMTEPIHATLNLERGRSSSRKEGTSGTRQRRRCSSSVPCPATQTGTGNLSEQSGGGNSRHRVLLDNSAPDLEQNLPDSTSSLGGVTDDLPSIPAVCKKEDGSRLYNKKQYCLYCKLGVIKMARHLERAHQDIPDVARAVSFPKGSKERRMHMELLRNKGNFAHNVEVLNSGVGIPVPRKQPKDESQVQKFLHCAYCQGFYTKKVLWRHMKICKFKPSIPLKPGRTRVQALCGFAAPPPPGMKEQLWKLLNKMVQDEVYFAVKSDPCIMEYGEHLFNRLGYDPGKHEYIRQKLRELGRLLICSRKNTPLKMIQDHIKPANFMYVIEAVKDIAGYNGETDAYRCPSLALKVGYSLKKISMLVESRANVQSDYSAAKDARTFRSVYEARWNELISAASLRTLQESKWNTPQLLPFTKDVQTLHSFLDAQQEELFSQLSSETSPQTWAQLTKVILTKVILFNRRRSGEVSKIPVSAYLSHNPSDPQEEVNLALSDLEKKLCQHFRRIEIRGKRGRKVPVLLTPPVQAALDLLIRKRQECGVLPENTYLFARPTTLICYRGSDCLRHFAKVCGAKNPESLTSTKLRKQTGTLSQVLNLTNTELDQLADFLGHDIRVHRQFYRLPEGTLQLAKISKVLMALEQGCLAEFKGKSLDDICIDPEENVHLDSDQERDPEAPCDPEADDESDSPENATTTEDSETIGPDVRHTVNNAAPQQDTVTTPQARDHQKPVKRLKGRQPSKRKTWEKEEIAAVERHMMSFITTCRVPGKSDCDKCLSAEKTALRDRNWLAIKFYIKNRITALKRTM